MSLYHVTAIKVTAIKYSDKDHRIKISFFAALWGLFLAEFFNGEK
jgi:hypothetical protein